MSLSFTKDAGALNQPSNAPHRRVLITGAAGRIGSKLAQHLQGRHDLRLMVRGDEDRIEQIRPLGEIVTANLSDLSRLKEACRGMDTVVHLAATPDSSAVWNTLLHDNIIGTYHLLAAAKAAGCRRVIFASSVHAVGGYPPAVQVKTTDPVNPGDLYGVSKCFGESLGRYMAEQEGLSVIALRIGAFQPVDAARRPEMIGVAEMFVSEHDLAQLIERCIDDTTLRWAVFHAVSNNRFQRLDMTDARELLGYRPQDDFTELSPAFKDLHLAEHLHTGSLRDKGQRSGLREEIQ
ncbi:MAG TPA: NAD(P)-dependent oxidoreductase [Tepidisphaeraceae bacterium]|jgi:nucleoside-diphosphate-sugar epimerase